MAQSVKDERLQIRVNPDEKRLLERAAEAAHLSVSAFVVAAAAERAESVLAERQVVALSPAAAEAAGYRPCLRCRPDVLPVALGGADAPDVVRRALVLIGDGVLDRMTEVELGRAVGMSARQLRRLFVEAVGTTPARVGRSRRAHFARRLLDDTDHCLSAGGDMVCHVADPARPAWRIGIEDPVDPRRIRAVVPVRHGAVATSGAAHRGAHVVDARTGRAPASLGSVTVIGPDLVWADIDFLPAVLTPEDALAGDTLLFEESGTNAAIELLFGEDDAAFEGCEVVIEHDFLNQRVAGCPLEVRSAAGRGTTISATIQVVLP